MRWVNSDSPFKQRKFWFPPCRYGDPFIRITWCAWIAATGERRYVGTSARVMPDLNSALEKVE
jgi:hypothetical protein